MAANGASCEQPQKRAGPKDKQNGKSTDLSLRERRQKDKDERLSLVLWRRPLVTLHYFLLETLIKLKEWTLELWHRRGAVLLVLLLCFLFSITYSTDGSHQTVLLTLLYLLVYKKRLDTPPVRVLCRKLVTGKFPALGAAVIVPPPPCYKVCYVQYLEKKFLWCAYWVGLGILSSVGLGTGLHTFLLYLMMAPSSKPRNALLSRGTILSQNTHQSEANRADL